MVKLMISSTLIRIFGLVGMISAFAIGVCWAKEKGTKATMDRNDAPIVLTVYSDYV
jgi:hypothetical protein